MAAASSQRQLWRAEISVEEGVNKETKRKQRRKWGINIAIITGILRVSLVNNRNLAVK